MNFRGKGDFVASWMHMGFSRWTVPMECWMLWWATTRNRSLSACRILRRKLVEKRPFKGLERRLDDITEMDIMRRDFYDGRRTEVTQGLIDMRVSVFGFYCQRLCYDFYLYFNFFVQEKVTTYVKNGSRIAVMNVIGFLCISLGSSVIHLHDSLGSRRACACSEAGFSIQNGDRYWRFYYRRAAFCYAFFLAKGHNVKDIHKRNVSCLLWEVFVT
jgi:hypothetical protein